MFCCVPKALTICPATTRICQQVSRVKRKLPYSLPSLPQKKINFSFPQPHQRSRTNLPSDKISGSDPLPFISSFISP
jgi:hypothetical protein